MFFWTTWMMSENGIKVLTASTHSKKLIS